MRRRPVRRKIKASYPSAYEREYRAVLRRLVDEVRTQLLSDLLPVYDTSIQEFVWSVRQDSWMDALTTAIHTIRLRLQDPIDKASRVPLSLGERIAAFAKKPWQKIAEAQVSVNIFRPDSWLGPMLQSWAEENVKLITSIPEQYLDRVAIRAQDMVRQGRSMESFKRELMKIYNLTKNRAELIARTEVGKLNGQITKARQTTLGLNEYEWSTSGDERVRFSHRVLNGKICRWDDPAVYREPDEPEKWKRRVSIGGYIGDPGEDFQCRCVAFALVEAYLDQLAA